jgi:hypothetical protein
MNRRWMRVGAMVFTLGCARAHKASLPLAPALGARAIIGEGAARFIFPIEASDSINWPGLSQAYLGYLLRYWQVGWEKSLSYDRFGEDPDGIFLGLEWQKKRTHQWALANLLRRMSPEVLTFCKPCGTPAETPREDRAVSAIYEQHRIIILVVGQDAIRRIFPRMPDSVTFSRMRIHTGGEHEYRDHDSLSVAVEH